MVITKKVKLGQITLKIGSGATPRGGQESYKNKGISLIRSLNIYNFTFNDNGLAFIDQEQADKLANVELYKNDILLNITGASVARCCIVPSKILPARVNQHVAIVRVNPNYADPFYVLYTINSPHYKDHLLSLAQGGATREALTKETISNFEILLPPLLIQRTIASILSNYDDLIENNNRRIKILEEMAKTVYQEWFVKFRFPNHENVKMIESELGLIPEGWEVKKIKDLSIQIIDGDRSKKYPKSQDFQSDGILFLNTKTIVENKLNFEQANYISQEKFTEIKKGRLQKLDIVMTTRGSIGKIALFNCQYRTGIINAQMLILRSNNDQIDQIFLYFLMCNDIFQDSIKSFSSGSAQPQIPIRDLQEINIICPSINIQKNFSKFVFPLIESIKNLQQKNDNLRKTRDLLLPKLISGEIDVENLDINTERLAS